MRRCAAVIGAIALARGAAAARSTIKCRQVESRSRTRKGFVKGCQDHAESASSDTVILLGRTCDVFQSPIAAQLFIELATVFDQ